MRGRFGLSTNDLHRPGVNSSLALRVPPALTASSSARVLSVLSSAEQSVVSSQSGVLEIHNAASLMGVNVSAAWLEEAGARISTQFRSNRQLGISETGVMSQSTSRRFSTGKRGP
jgi:hypothetical protein